jgi:hypothetical protein
VQGRVQFYLNDGSADSGYAAPGTKFYDSGWFDNFGPTPGNTLRFFAGGDLPATGLLIPASDITWTVQFQGMGSGDSVGLALFSPPQAGSSYPDYWQYDGSSWALETNSVPMNFASLFEASLTPVPEPTTPAFLLLGGLATLVFRRRS